MKKVKTIDTINGKIDVYEDDTYMLRRTFKSYSSLILNKRELLYDLIDAGFVIKNLSLCLNTNKKYGIVFYLDVNMNYLQ